MNVPRTLYFALCSLLMTSCSSFEKEWNQSVAEYKAGNIETPAGPWVGSWNTTTNGHMGDLRAIVKPSPARNGEYSFRYHATWGSFFRGTYQVDFPVIRRGSTYQVDGSKSLGPFGRFGHKAKIKGHSFNATYSSDKGDLGTFDLKRP